VTLRRPGRWAIRPTAPPGCRWDEGDAGSTTAELAVGLPGLVLLTFAGIGAVSAVLTQLQCVDAAREAARAAARGESGVVAGDRVAPPGSTVVVEIEGDVARATVRARPHPLGRRLPAITITATAVAALEPGEPGPSGRPGPARGAGP